MSYCPANIAKQEMVLDAKRALLPISCQSLFTKKYEEHIVSNPIQCPPEPAKRLYLKDVSRIFDRSSFLSHFLWLAAFCLLVAGLIAPVHAQQTGTLSVELNKVEPSETGGCSAFFLFRNDTANSFEGFEMSLAILNTQGVIDRLLSTDAAPLPVARTTLKLFEIPEIACTDISEILLHDMTSCRPQNGEEIDCFPILNLSSKAAAALVK